MFHTFHPFHLHLSCQTHPTNPLNFVCVDPHCQQCPFMCSECLQAGSYSHQHYGHNQSIKEIIQAVQELSESLAHSKNPIEGIYASLKMETHNSSLFKYLQQKDQHLQSIKAHLETIEFQVEEELTGILQTFQQELKKQKQVILAQLQRHYESYRDKFQLFSKKVTPIVEIANEQKYFASKHSILLKMMADPDPTVWFNRLKRNINMIETIVSTPKTEYENIRKLSMSANDLIDQLPCFNTADQTQQLTRIINTAVKAIMKKLVCFGDRRCFSPINRSYSAQADGYVIYQHPSRIQDVTWIS